MRKHKINFNIQNITRNFGMEQCFGKYVNLFTNWVIPLRHNLIASGGSENKINHDDHNTERLEKFGIEDIIVTCIAFFQLQGSLSSQTG